MKQLTYSSMAAARLRANRRGYAGVALGIFLSVFLVSTLALSVWGIYQAELARRQDLVGDLDMVMMDNEVVTEAELAAFPQFDRLGHAYIQGIVTDRNVYVGHYDETGLALLNLQPEEGRLPQSAGEIALERSAMDTLELSVQVGDSVELDITAVDGAQQTRTYRVVGILPERSVYLSIPDTDGLKEFPGIVTSPEEPAFPVGRVGIHYLLGLAPGASVDDALKSFRERYGEVSGVYNRFYALSVSGQQVSFAGTGSWLEADQEMYTLVLMAGLLAGALILSCGVGISGAMEGILSKRREEIGVLRALGATRRQIRRMFGRENLLLAVLVAPLSIAASIAAVGLLAALMPDVLRLSAPVWLLAPVAVASAVVVLLSGYLPLVRASKQMPMSVLRDTAMLRRSRGLRSRAEFSVPRLMSLRQIRFHPTRQLGASVLVGLTLLCCGMLSATVYGYAGQKSGRSQDFRITSNHSFSTLGYIPLYNGQELSAQSIRQLQDLAHVEQVSVRREMLVFAQVETVPRYALLPMMAQDQYGMLDDALFEEAMTIPGVDTAFARELRDLERETYLDLLADYGFTGEAFQMPLITVALTGDDLQTLQDSLVQGSIDQEALDAGQQVLIYAPDVWCYSTDTGGFNNWYSQEAVLQDDRAQGAELVAWNDVFSAGQQLSLTQLYSLDEGASVQRRDTQVQVGGILAGDQLAGRSIYACCYILTTEEGLEHLGLLPWGLRDVQIYLDGPVTQEQEEVLERQITAIARRADSSVQNDLERTRARQQSRRQELLVYICVSTVFFAVSVGMIVSTVTRQLNSAGKTIGMLRAVGADEKAILGCFSGQLHGAVLGGLTLTLGLIAVFLGIWAIDAAVYQYRFWYRTLATQVALLVLTALAMAAACWALCRWVLGLRVRQIVDRSIIENIREL